MKTKWTKLAILLAGVALEAATAQAAVIYSTLGPGGSFDTGAYAIDGSAQYQAFLFNPSGSGNLDSITVALARQTELTTQTQFNLYTGSSTTIGALLESFIVPNLAQMPGTLVTMNSLSHPFLSAGGNYWLSFTEPNAPNGSSSIWLFTDQAMHTTRITPASTLAGSIDPAFQVNATSTPEPSTELPVGAGLIVAAFLIRRRRRGSV